MELDESVEREELVCGLLLGDNEEVHLCTVQYNYCTVNAIRIITGITTPFLSLPLSLLPGRGRRAQSTGEGDPRARQACHARNPVCDHVDEEERVSRLATHPPP